ncbi:hypothetical protein CLV45_4652 [Hymenobacter chitinivorans DSM 11115]|uniref:Uncharacterized protein n=1 Tax=Hymenobacter chitinivorans DSM 11115 TaxID=1121954 RepID=A0A2M9AQI1_9BACT|nr:hypothetical protein CLV45_4652 [Hymenobacter chitinivorans DSM 11115]
MKFFLLSILFSCLLLAGCHSARLATLPTVREYGPAEVQPSSRVSSLSADRALPPLTATVAAPTPSVEHPTRQLPSKPTYTVPASPSPVVVAPDTALTRATGPAPGAGADPFTTRINMLGGAVGAAGVGIMLYAFSDASRERNPSGWGSLFEAFMGFVALAVGVSLLFFQGKNGRGRLRREARRAARHPQAPDAATESNGSRGLRRWGIVLGLVGVVLGLLGALQGGLLFFIVGAVLLLAGLF